MRVFLDDVRPTPEGWVRARTPEEVIELPEITIHSSNPVGRQRLQRALDAIERRLREPPDGLST